MSPETPLRPPHRAGAADPPSPNSRTPDPSPVPFAIDRKVPSRRREPERRAEAGTRTDGLPAQLWERPTSILIHGPSRPLVNLTLFAFSELTTPRFQWVDIQVPGEPPLATDPVRLGWVPAEQLWTIDRPSALRPDDLVANLALFSLVRSDEPSSSLVQLTEFLRLPEVSQRILAARPRRGEPGVVAVANAHRVMSAFPAERVPAILGVHRSSGYSVYIGFAEAPGAGAELFDLVFRLDGETVAGWKRARLTCTKGIRSGPLAEGRSVDLGDVAPLAEVFSRLPASE